MTEAELERLTRLTVRNVLRLEGIAEDITRNARQELKQVYKGVLDQLRDLPTGSVERQMAYDRISETIESSFDLPAVRLQSDLQVGVTNEAPEQVLWAADYVELADIAEPSLMRRLAVEAVQDVRVLNKAVEDMARPLSMSEWRRIDKAVREGYLRGETNSQVMKRVADTFKGAKSELRTLARTAMMSLAQEAHNKFWDANSDLIVAWRWDASMDHRVCPVCAPMDGVEHKTRAGFGLMQPPAHPNCRCHLVPITEQIRAREQIDEGQRSMQELVPEQDLPRRSGESARDFLKRHRSERMADERDLSVRYFMKPVTINGKRYYRRVTDVLSKDGKAMTMGGFLQRANNVTQESVLQSKKRARRFRELIKGTPEVARH